MRVLLISLLLPLLLGAEEAFQCGADKIQTDLAKTVVQFNCKDRVSQINKCCIAHDACYEKQEPRATCDTVFCSCVQAASASNPLCGFYTTMFCDSAKIFGEPAYKKVSERKKAEAAAKKKTPPKPQPKPETETRPVPHESLMKAILANRKAKAARTLEIGKTDPKTEVKEADVTKRIKDFKSKLIQMRKEEGEKKRKEKEEEKKKNPFRVKTLEEINQEIKAALGGPAAKDEEEVTVTRYDPEAKGGDKKKPEPKKPEPKKEETKKGVSHKAESEKKVKVRSGVAFNDLTPEEKKERKERTMRMLEAWSRRRDGLKRNHKRMGKKVEKGEEKKEEKVEKVVEKKVEKAEKVEEKKVEEVENVKAAPKVDKKEENKVEKDQEQVEAKEETKVEKKEVEAPKKDESLLSSLASVFEKVSQDKVVKVEEKKSEVQGDVVKAEEAKTTVSEKEAEKKEEKQHEKVETKDNIKQEKKEEDDQKKVVVVRVSEKDEVEGSGDGDLLKTEKKPEVKVDAPKVEKIESKEPLLSHDSKSELALIAEAKKEEEKKEAERLAKVAEAVQKKKQLNEELARLNKEIDEEKQTIREERRRRRKEEFKRLSDLHRKLSFARRSRTRQPATTTPLPVTTSDQVEGSGESVPINQSNWTDVDGSAGEDRLRKINATGGGIVKEDPSTSLQDLLHLRKDKAELKEDPEDPDKIRVRELQEKARADFENFARTVKQSTKTDPKIRMRKNLREKAAEATVRAVTAAPTKAHLHPTGTPPPRRHWNNRGTFGHRPQNQNVLSERARKALRGSSVKAGYEGGRPVGFSLDEEPDLQTVENQVFDTLSSREIRRAPSSKFRAPLPQAPVTPLPTTATPPPPPTSPPTSPPPPPPPTTVAAVNQPFNNLFHNVPSNSEPGPFAEVKATTAPAIFHEKRTPTVSEETKKSSTDEPATVIIDNPNQSIFHKKKEEKEPLLPITSFLEDSESFDELKSIDVSVPASTPAKKHEKKADSTEDAGPFEKLLHEAQESLKQSQSRLDQLLNDQRLKLEREEKERKRKEAESARKREEVRKMLEERKARREQKRKERLALQARLIEKANKKEAQRRDQEAKVKALEESTRIPETSGNSESVEEVTKKPRRKSHHKKSKHTTTTTPEPDSADVDDDEDTEEDSPEATTVVTKKKSHRHAKNELDSEEFDAFQEWLKRRDQKKKSSRRSLSRRDSEGDEEASSEIPH